MICPRTARAWILNEKKNKKNIHCTLHDHSPSVAHVHSLLLLCRDTPPVYHRHRVTCPSGGPVYRFLAFAVLLFDVSLISAVLPPPPPAPLVTSRARFRSPPRCSSMKNGSGEAVRWDGMSCKSPRVCLFLDVLPEMIHIVDSLLNMRSNLMLLVYDNF